MATKMMNKEEAQQVASTIISQLTHGGAAMRLTAMLGASNLSYSNTGRIQFHFKMCRAANMVAIELNESDLYTMTFYKYSKKSLDVKEVKIYEEIYAEDLSRLFTQFTGLDTHL